MIPVGSKPLIFGVPPHGAIVDYWDDKGRRLTAIVTESTGAGTPEDKILVHVFQDIPERPVVPVACIHGGAGKPGTWSMPGEPRVL